MILTDIVKSMCVRAKRTDGTHEADRENCMCTHTHTDTVCPIVSAAHVDVYFDNTAELEC